jgi:archaellum component FlaC
MTVASLKQSMDRRFTRLERLMHRQFASVDEELESIDNRFESIDRRSKTIDKRVDDLEARLARRIDMRFESISDKLDSLAKGINERLAHHAQIDDEHEKRVRELEAFARSGSNRA